MQDGIHGDGQIDWRCKSWPDAGAGDVAGIGDRGWSILAEDVMFPVAVLNTAAMRHNSDWMRRFTAAAGVAIAPHGKTTMSPDLFALQLEDGAWGITAATAAQVRVYRRHGIRRIIMANQLVGKQALSYVLGEIARDPDFDFYCLVDSLESVAILSAAVAAAKLPRPLQVLVELGIEGGRTGARDDATALAVASAAASAPGLALRGIEAFEGILQGAGADAEARMCALLARIAAVAASAGAQGLFTGRPILSAGGSSFFDVVAAVLSAAGNDYEVVLRSGCYLVHDSGFYADLVARMATRSPLAAGLGDGLRAAIEVWAVVHSRPEPGRVVAGLGKRDVSADVRIPVPLRWASPGTAAAHLPPCHVTVRIDDHHAYLDVPENSPLQVGDLVGFGISHPCTTFDRWPLLYLVDDALAITGAVRTFF